jgi:hypothetical protein
MYYQERVLPRLRERLAIEPAPTGPMIAVIRELTKEIYNAEDDVTKAEVAKKVAEQALHVDGEDRDEELARTPQEYQEYVMINFTHICVYPTSFIFSAIDQLPAYLDEVVRVIERLTGLSGTFLVGGPIPAMNGALSTIR